MKKNVASMDSDKKALLILDLDNEGLCYVISLRHFNYYETELLLERSSVSQRSSVSLECYIT